jgi:hypothetical protein
VATVTGGMRNAMGLSVATIWILCDISWAGMLGHIYADGRLSGENQKQLSIHHQLRSAAPLLQIWNTSIGLRPA